MRDQRLELRRVRNLGEVISDSFAFLTPNWKTFAAVAGPAVMITILMQLVFFLLMPESIDTENLSDEQAEELLRDALIAAGAVLALLPVMWVIYQLSTAGAVVVLKGIGEGKTLSAGDALDAAQDRAKDILLSSLRSIAIIMLLSFTIIGIPWAIKRSIQWCLIIQCVILDGATHREALNQSARLIEGHWWYTLGRLIVAGIVVGLPGSVASSLLAGVFPGVIGIILGGCVGFFTIPYPIIATTLIFFDEKARKGTVLPDVAAGL